MSHCLDEDLDPFDDHPFVPVASPILGVFTRGGVTYETLPQSELDELRQAKRLRDEAIKALRSDRQNFLMLKEQAGDRRDWDDADRFEAKAEAVRVVLRYLGAEGEG